MKITVEKNIGGANFIFEIDEPKELDALNKAIVLANPPELCEECGNDKASEFRLTSNKDGDANIYVNVECKRCGAKAKLGLYKSGSYFWHRFQKYIPKP